jgi:hypothetical protein
MSSNERLKRYYRDFGFTYRHGDYSLSMFELNVRHT